MLNNLTGWHALIIFAVIVLIFGATKLPALARSVGQSMRILKQETAVDSAHSDDSSLASADLVTTPATSTSPMATGVAQRDGTRGHRTQEHGA